MHFDSDLIILDEPTNNLGVAETQGVLSFVRNARDSGHSCIFIAHNIHHVFRVVDRIVVLRAGASLRTTSIPRRPRSSTWRPSSPAWWSLVARWWAHRRRPCPPEVMGRPGSMGVDTHRPRVEGSQVFFLSPGCGPPLGFLLPLLLPGPLSPMRHLYVGD